MEYIYACKKNGLEYLYTTTLEFTEPQDAYAWRRGVREYADNYHASITRKDWEGTDEAFAEKIDEACTEARDRFHAGDVPGERAPSADKAKLVSLAARARKAGVDPIKMLEQFLAEQESQGRAA
jgi:hypothetical protein